MPKKAAATKPTSDAAALIAETREAMSVDLQQLAAQGLPLIKKEAEAVLDYYDVGALVAKATNNERRYGTSAVRQLAIVWYGSASREADLQSYRYVAASYDRKHLQKLLKAAGDTSRLTFSHVRELSRLTGNARLAKRRDKLEEVIVSDGLGIRELKQEVARALGGGKQSNGGRAAAPPRSPIAGLQQLTQQLRQLQSREAIVTDYVLQPLADVEEDAVTPELAEIMQTAYSAIEEAVAMLQTYNESLSQLIEKASQTLQNRGEESVPEDDSPEDEDQEDEDPEDEDPEDDEPVLEDEDEDEEEAPAPKASKKKKKKRATASV
jgi:hypothetical protein